MASYESSSRPFLTGLLATTFLIGGGVFVYAGARQGLYGSLGRDFAKSGERPFANTVAMQRSIEQIEEKLRDSKERVGTNPNVGEGPEYLESKLWRERLYGTGSPEGNFARLSSALDQMRKMSSWGNLGGAGGGGVRPRSVGGKGAAPASGGGITAMGSAWPGVPAQLTQWEFVGPRDLKPAPQLIYFGPAQSRASGRVNDVAYDPTDPTGNTAYIASAGGGVWKTTNGGQDWQQLSDSTFDQLQTSGIAVTATGVVLVGLGDYPGGNAASRGVMRSTDGGATWVRVAAAIQGTYVSQILCDPDLPNVVYMTTGGGTAARTGVYKSNDSGINWTKLNPPIATGDFTKIAIAAPDPGTGARFLYVSRAADLNAGTSIFRSSDRGATWTNLTLGIPGQNSFNSEVEVAASPNDPNVVYYVDASTGQTDGRILKSNQAGAANTWVDVTGDFPDGAEVGQPGYNYSQFSYDRHLDCGTIPVPGQDIDQLFLGGITLAATLGGSNWTDVGQSYVSAAAVQTHSDQHGMAFNPANPLKSLITNDGGVYGLTFDPNVGTWTFAGGYALNRTLGVSQFYDADWHPNNPDWMLGGTQDNSSPAALGDVQHWDNVGAGDGFGSAINPVNTAIQYTSSQFDNIIGTGDSWASRSFISPDWGADELPFISRMALSPAAPNYLYVATNNLWRFDSNKATGRWNDPTWDPNTAWDPRLGGTNLCPDSGQGFETITAIAPSPSDPSIVYVGTAGIDFATPRLLGKLWMLKFRNTGNGFRDPANAQWKRLDIYNPGTGDVRSFPPGAIFTNVADGQIRISSVKVNPSNPYDILVGTTDNSPVAANNGVRLWRCRNTNNVWSNPQILPQFIPVSGIQGTPTALTTLPPSCIEFHPNDPSNSFFVGNEIGVFITRDGGSTWFNAGTNLGLPVVPVNAMRAIRATGFLNIATYGRGMWRMPINVFDQAVPSPFKVTPNLTRGASISCTIRVQNLNQRQLSGVSIVGAQFIPSTGTLSNTTTALPVNLTPNQLSYLQEGRGTVQFANTTGRSGTLGTLRFTFRYQLASSTVNAVNDVTVRLP